MARIFNSAVAPYEGAFIGVFRGEQTNGVPYIYLGRSQDAIHWTFEQEKIRFVDQDGQPAMPIYAYDPRLVKVEDTYYAIWCQDFYGASIGGAILDLDEPSKVLCRCESFLLTPEEWYEERGFVPNVCFPCATLQDADTGRIALYYGCADSYVGLAFTTVDEVVGCIKEHDAASADDHELGKR